MTTKLPGMFCEVIEDVPSHEDAPYLSAVYTTLNGKYFAYNRTPGGASGSKHFDTREEAEADLAKTQEFHRKFWQEKVDWHKNGDRTPQGAWCLRINGAHYVCKPDDKGTGFGGRTFRWQMLKDIAANKIGLGEPAPIYTTNNMWHQGQIPPEFRDRLPDNAVWVENTSAVG